MKRIQKHDFSCGIAWQLLSLSLSGRLESANNWMHVCVCVFPCVRVYRSLQASLLSFPDCSHGRCAHGDVSLWIRELARGGPSSLGPWSQVRSRTGLWGPLGPRISFEVSPRLGFSSALSFGSPWVKGRLPPPLSHSKRPNMNDIVCFEQTPWRGLAHPTLHRPSCPLSCWEGRLFVLEKPQPAPVAHIISPNSSRKKRNNNKTEYQAEIQRNEKRNRRNKTKKLRISEITDIPWVLAICHRTQESTEAS